MSGWQGKGGGTKDFKADPIKQFLISRGCSRDRAVDLCVAGKIELKDIPDMTDKLTLIHFGCINVSDAVDAEIKRIALKVQDRADKTNGKDKPPVDNKRNDEEGDTADQRDQEQNERDQAQREYDEAMDKDKKNDPPPVTYQCKECLKNYKTASGLKNHVSNKHGGDKE